MNLLLKTLELRKNYKIKSQEPMRAFNQKVSRSREILRIIEKHATSKSVKQEARRLFLVTVAAGFELYWRDLIRLTIDKNRISLKSNSKSGDIKFTMADVEMIIGNKVTPGELLSNSYTFQDPQTVNKVLSYILNFDAFTEFGKAKFELHEVSRKNRSKKAGTPFKTTIHGKQILNHIKMIEKCFEIRHATVHDTGVRYRISETETLLIENAVWQFNTFFEMFVFGQLIKGK